MKGYPEFPAEKGVDPQAHWAYVKSIARPMAASEEMVPMTAFRDTDAAAAFIASAESRETSQKVMEAIAFLARNEAEAEAVWQGDGLGRVCHLSDVWEHATGNGRHDDSDLLWDGRTLATVMAENA